MNKEDYFSVVELCPLCGIFTRNSLMRFSVTQLIWKIDVKECSNCGFVFKSNMPNDRLMAYIYSTSYVHFQSSSQTEIIDKKDDIFFSRVKRLGILTQNRRRHLDYGCGAGEFVKSALRNGWDSYGCDPFLPTQFETGILADRLYKLNVLDSKTAGIIGEFDVISLWAVAEHIEKPLQTFKALTLLLKPNGSLVFNWPNGDSLVAKKFGAQWSMSLLLEHITFATPKSILWLAKELNLKVDKITYCGSPYPFGKIKQPSLLSQGIKALPFSEQSQEQTEFKTQKSKDSNIRSIFLSKNGDGFLSNLTRIIIDKTKTGDHIEVVFTKDEQQ